MNILATSNHGDTLNPKEGADARKHNFLIELTKCNNIVLLESSRYKRDEVQVPPNVRVYYFREYFLGSKPLSPFTDFNPSFISMMRRITKDEDIGLIQISFPTGIIATRLITILMRKKIPIVYDAHNVEGDLAREVRTPDLPRPLSNMLVFYAIILERFAIKCATHIIAVSKKDAERFGEKYKLPKSKITVIPSGVRVRSPDRISSRNELRGRFGIEKEQITILFHGTYAGVPNREAMNLITTYIAPRMTEVNKNALFIIAGTGVPVFQKDNVKSIGFVEDLQPLLNASDIAVVPLLKGGGIKQKVLDYLGAGLPIVVTKKAAEGMELRDHEHALIVDDVNENFIDAIKYLIDNERERKGIGANARKLAEEKYDWGKIGKKLDKLYREILGEKSG